LRSEQFTLKREQFCTVLILDWVYLHSDCGNRRGCRIGFFEESGTGKLRSAIDGDEEIEFAFFCPDLGDVDVEEADRVGLEFFLGCFFAFDFEQPGDAVALQTAVERRAGQMRDCGLQSVETVVERKQGLFPESDDASSSLLRTVDLGAFGPISASAVEVLRFHLATGLRVDPVVPAKAPMLA
jgi:hypothetical protein